MPLPPIKITLARKDVHFKRILELQRANLREALDTETAAAEGFVTATHDLPLLKRMAAAAAPVIALDERKLAGYCLAMTRDFAAEVPVLTDLFARQDAIVHRGERLGDSDYLVMGQICVAPLYRGTGAKIADRMYKYLRACYHLRFPYCVTAVDAANTRSLRVHERVGFTELQRWRAPDGHHWVIVIWNWRDGMEGFD